MLPKTLNPKPPSPPPNKPLHLETCSKNNNYMPNPHPPTQPPNLLFRKLYSEIFPKLTTCLTKVKKNK